MDAGGLAPLLLRQRPRVVAETAVTVGQMPVGADDVLLTDKPRFRAVETRNLFGHSLTCHRYPSVNLLDVKALATDDGGRARTIAGARRSCAGAPLHGGERPLRGTGRRVNGNRGSSASPRFLDGANDAPHKRRLNGRVTGSAERKR